MKRKLYTLTSVLLVCCLLFATTAFALDDTTPAYKAHLTYKDDGSFRILQISDIQDAVIMHPIVKDYIKDIVPATKPDLIVLTGDNISGGTTKSMIPALNKQLVCKAINEFMSVLQGYGIPVAVVFGNHDAETSVTKEEQMAIYRSYSCCIGFDEGSSVYGCGNYNVPIYSSKDSSKIAYNLWMIDSNMYDYDASGKSNGYDYVHQDQIDWYVNTSNELKAQNGGKAVPSMMFQHIIVPEIFDALLEVPAGTEGAVQHGDKYYVLNPSNTRAGVLHEVPCPSNTNGGQFDAVVKQGDVVAMFFGHDHTNSFEVTLRGVDLVATPAITFESYGDAGRGARVIDLAEGSTYYSTHIVTYQELYNNDKAEMERFTMYGNEFSKSQKIQAFFKYIYLKLTSILKFA